MGTKEEVEIEKVNYFGESTKSNDFNAKCLYRKNGKLYLAHIYIDFFNKHVYTSKNQPKECKVLKGFSNAINSHEFPNNQ